ncbi:helix-turn-helix transcriptional regulator, partial [Streptomyces alkaliphilus]|uniref:helix-turn-helix transcriptional regulator n=1 Tax=Streptomyces alkaliphilus TaxID=1472722 RepID=UPI00117EB67E|nr:helix-turn-helix domain-containing protein [Streptomyces alkaliphilus]
VGGTLWTRPPRPVPGTARILPDGCMDLLWSEGRLLVAGPDTRAHLAHDPPGRDWLGLRFPPGTAPLVLGVPAVELRDVRVPLTELWSAAEVRELEDRLARAPVPGAVLEEHAAARLRAAPPLDPLLLEVARAAARPGLRVAALAERLGLGERRLHRRCLAAFGYGPRMLHRVLRMRRALALIDAGRAPAEAAHLVGCADQPHLSREVRTLAGVPLRELRRTGP